MMDELGQAGIYVHHLLSLLSSFSISSWMSRPPTMSAFDNVAQLSQRGVVKGTPASGRLPRSGTCELMGNAMTFSVIDGPQDEQRQ